MNNAALLVLGIAVVNPARVRLLLGARTPATRSRAAFTGGLAATVVAIVLAALGQPLIDALGIAPETFRIASGMIITLSGVLAVAWPAGDAEHLRGELRDALIPVAYPILLVPGAVLTWLVVGIDEGIGTVALIALAGHAAPAAFAGLSDGRRGAWLGAVRLTAAVVVVMGVAMVIDGVREV